MTVAVVYIAGHGRMYTGEPPTRTIPARIAMGWAVPEGVASTPYVSRNMIAGRNNELSEYKTAGQTYKEHWLVADGGENMTLKARDLVKALNNTPGWEGLHSLSKETYWLLQPCGNNAVTLSAILDYLPRKIPLASQIDVLWTCCRSPIGQKGTKKAEIHGPDFDTYIIGPKTSGEETKDPVASREFNSFNLHHIADGTVTLVQASDEAKMKSVNTWKGILGADGTEGFVKNNHLRLSPHPKLPD